MKTKISFLCLSALLLFTQCSKEFETYYERPDWLEDPIYQILEEDGDFTLYLQAVDRTLHQQVLKGAGLYTCFAPNDEAFNQWMSQNGFKSVEEIPQSRIDALVSYSLVYNLFKQENLGSALVSKLWTPGLAYKYKTTYYPMLSRDVYEGDSVWVFDENRPGSYSVSSKSDIVGNYKYLPVYTQAYFNANPDLVPESDYKTFYTSSKWTGMNVGPASMVPVSGDTLYQRLAENGVVYEIDQVVEPVDNMFNVIDARKDEFSDYLAILNYQTADGTSYFKQFAENESVTEAFQLVYPEKNIDKVYIRAYSGLNFSPISEAYTGEKQGSDATQENASTLFLPTNEAMQEFKEKRLMKYYTSIDEVPLEAMTIFLNTQVADHLVWPSIFKTSQNSQNEYLNGLGKEGKDLEEAGIKEKLMTSNGIIYVTDSVIKSSYFETVYAEIFLNPLYTWLNTAYVNYYNGGLRTDLMKSELNGYVSERNTILLFDDNLLKEDGIEYDQVNNVFTHPVTDGPLRLQRLIKDHVFCGYRDDSTTGMFGADLTPAVIAGQGEGYLKPLSTYNSWIYRVNNYGELVRFKENRIQGIGDAEEGTWANVIPVNDHEDVVEYPNGHVLRVDKLLKYSPLDSRDDDSAYTDRTMWYYLDLARTENPDVSLFVDYVEAFMKNADNTITGMKSSNFYTVLMPNNTAMKKAQAAGLLPGTAVMDEQDQSGTNKALRFLQGHFLQGRIICDDNLPIIYPVEATSDDYTSYILPTMLTITDEKLGLTNEKTRVKVYKRRASSTSNTLYFCAQNITSGGQIKVKGFPEENAMNEQAYRNHATVTRKKIANESDMCHSNRMACKAVLHEVNNYIYFVNQ